MAQQRDVHEDGRADECDAADDAAPFRFSSRAGGAAGLREERQRSGDVVGYVEQACQSPQRRTVGCIGHTGEGGGVFAYLREAARVGRNGNRGNDHGEHDDHGAYDSDNVDDTFESEEIRHQNQCTHAGRTYPVRKSEILGKGCACTRGHDNAYQQQENGDEPCEKRTEIFAAVVTKSLVGHMVRSQIAMAMPIVHQNLTQPCEQHKRDE